jgi:hypothetical protein
MTTLAEAARRFLSHRRIAVTGVSRVAQGHGGNVVYQRLRERGYQVFAVNPNADRVEGDPCFHDLASIPGGVDAVVIATRPVDAITSVRECAALGIRHVWMHKACGTGSVSGPAADWARDHGLSVIEGGCPLMFGRTADLLHRLMRFVLTRTGDLPKHVV